MKKILLFFLVIIIFIFYNLIIFVLYKNTFKRKNITFNWQDKLQSNLDYSKKVTKSLEQINNMIINASNDFNSSHMGLILQSIEENMMFYFQYTSNNSLTLNELLQQYNLNHSELEHLIFLLYNHPNSLNLEHIKKTIISNIVYVFLQNKHNKLLNQINIDPMVNNLKIMQNANISLPYVLSTIYQMVKLVTI